MMETLALAGTSLGLGLGSGVNAYATFLVFGLLSRFYPQLFGGDFASFFASTPVLSVLAVLYVIEFVADKIPAVDHAWDAVHTFIRPLAGAFVAVAAQSPEVPQGAVVLAGIIGGSAAIATHSGKALLRGASTATTGGFANPLLSLVEDVYAILQALFAIFLPYVVLFLTVVVLIPLAAVLVLRSRRTASER